MVERSHTHCVVTVSSPTAATPPFSLTQAKYAHTERTHLNRFLEKSWIIRSSPANERETLDALLDRGQVPHTGPELHAMLRLAHASILGELRSPRSAGSSAQKPGLHNVTEPGGRAFALEHLLAVVPAHTAARSTATNQYHFALTVRWSRGSEGSHGDASRMCVTVVKVCKRRGCA